MPERQTVLPVVHARQGHSFRLYGGEAERGRQTGQRLVERGGQRLLSGRVCTLIPTAVSHQEGRKPNSSNYLWSELREVCARLERRALTGVVERDPHLRALEHWFLEEAGCAVVFADDGAQGLERTHPPASPLDLGDPPAPDGLSECRTLKSRQATARDADQAAGDDAGVGASWRD